MMIKQINTGKLFLITSLIMLMFGLLVGVLASSNYVLPGNLKESLGFITLRPMHVTSVMFWIIIGASGCVYSGIEIVSKKKISVVIAFIQWCLWLVAILGILYSYLTEDFGGREYWEFNPIWALPIAIAWLLFIINFIRSALTIKQWPVYVWMWMTGIVFFLFTFIENYLWMIPYFRDHFVTDMTIQWKVNGSLVGSWNQILYGTAFFLMERISKNTNIGRSKLVFAMYFLGLFNLMFNWGHHVYTLPTEAYIRYIGYAVTMTEWIIFARIIYTWRQSVTDAQKHYHYFPYRFLMAADIWVFLNIGQALLMSIPAINIYTHGTHVTVAHAMGTTIGINSMILLAACFEFLTTKCEFFNFNIQRLNRVFWFSQTSLLIFWLSLNIAGIKKAIWQMSLQQVPFSKMMEGLHFWFVLFGIAGVGLLISLTSLALTLVKAHFRCVYKLKPEKNTYAHQTPITN